MFGQSNYLRLTGVNNTKLCIRADVIVQVVEITFMTRNDNPQIQRDANTIVRTMQGDIIVTEEFDDVAQMLTPMNH